MEDQTFRDYLRGDSKAQERDNLAKNTLKRKLALERIQRQMKRVQALIDRPGSPEEKEAALRAMARLKQKIEEIGAAVKKDVDWLQAELRKESWFFEFTDCFGFGGRPQIPKESPAIKDA